MFSSLQIQKKKGTTHTLQGKEPHKQMNNQMSDGEQKNIACLKKKKTEQTSVYLIWISGSGCCAKGPAVSQFIWEFLM